MLRVDPGPLGGKLDPCMDKWPSPNHQPVDLGSQWVGPRGNWRLLLLGCSRPSPNFRQFLSLWE